MASNYSSDPKNALPISNSAVSQNAQSGVVPETSQTPSSAPSGGENKAVGNPRRLAPGTMLSGGRYKIEKLLASGGMGAVYRALDTRFNRPCAVKEMLDEFHNESERTQAVEWFAREATMLLDLNHPCIPRVRDFFAEEGRNYLVMDFIDGYTLAEVMECDGDVVGVNGARGVAEARARTWARQVCGVLGYLHQQTPPIIFRDLKPSNIMVTQRDEIKLIDFGIARTFQSQRQATVIMTLGYAPPEQLHGMPEPRSDIYALGATLHRVLTRHDAVNNKPNIFAFPPLRMLRPDLSPAFEQVVMRALAPNIEQRWSSAEEMERALINLPAVTVVPPRITLGGVNPQNTPSGGRSGVTPNVSQPHSGSGPHSGPAATPLPASNSTTGPAGTYITAALGHLATVPPRLDAAYDAVRMAHGIESNNALVHKIFGQIFARRIPADVDHAMQAYNRSLQLHFDDAETHKLVGDVSLFLRPNYVQAIAAYTQSLRLNPNDLEARERLGQCYERTNQLEAALREYQEAVRLATSPPQPQMVLLRLYFALGQLAKRLNQFPVAEHAFVQVLILNPADHDTRFLLCQVYEQEGKFEEAWRECGYVIGPLGKNPMVQQVYNRLRHRLGR